MFKALLKKLFSVVVSNIHLFLCDLKACRLDPTIASELELTANHGRI